MPTHIIIVAAICAASTCTPTEVRIWDRDTAWFGPTKVRMVGYDAPKFGDKSRCTREANLAKRSRERLAALLTDAEEVRIEPIGKRSYDRELAGVSIDGRDVGSILVEEGLATRARHDRVNWCS